MWMQKHLAQIVTIEVSFIRWTHMILSMGLSSSRLILDRIFTYACLLGSQLILQLVSTGTRHKNLKRRHFSLIGLTEFDMGTNKL